MDTETVAASVETRREQLIALSRDIWEHPQTLFEETYAAERLIDALIERGFTVEVGVGGIETAFLARYGEGGPVVGTMGEYDALPGLSQRATANREPVEDGAPGHGCGHNLFGVGSLGGALAAADAIDDGLVGTVVYAGTPAEEGGSGKTYMTRAGVFDDVDALVSWHPGWYNAPTAASCLSVDSFEVTARGTSSHAAAAPEAGRSALDAIQLLNTAVEYMREHVPDPVRLHYVITDGGAAPNVVPAEATAEYLVRAPSRIHVETVSEWFRSAARGAALMADVDVEVTQTGGVYGVRPNETLAAAIGETMTDLGGFEVTDRALAADLHGTFENGSDAVSVLPADARERAREGPYFTEPLDAFDAGTTGSYSTDSGDVSQVVPLGRMTTATFPVGTPLHSWQAVAASGSVGVDGMCYAAKTIGATLVRLLSDGDLLAAVTEEFEERGGIDYDSPMPADADPYELFDVERPTLDLKASDRVRVVTADD